jgi:hypothetical protein
MPGSYALGHQVAVCRAVSRRRTGASNRRTGVSRRRTGLSHRLAPPQRRDAPPHWRLAPPREDNTHLPASMPCSLRSDGVGLEGVAAAGFDVDDAEADALA